MAQRGAPRRHPGAPAKRERVEARSREFARIYDALIARNDVVALISSHVDYDNFGLAVEAALRHDVPVLFPQSTGGLKVYGSSPSTSSPHAGPRRAHRQIADFFEKHVWANRELLAPGRELTAWRSKAALGRPSWWRAGPAFSTSTCGAQDRGLIRTVRRDADRAGPGLPVVTVFNHAVSDALGTNVEAFSDLGNGSSRPPRSPRGMTR